MSRPIAVMLMEHEITRKLAKRMKESCKTYVTTGSSAHLITDMQEYINHVVQHIWKENNRLFEMAEMALKDNVDQVNANLDDVEKSTLREIGKSRTDYEKIAKELEQKFTGNSS